MHRIAATDHHGINRREICQNRSPVNVRCVTIRQKQNSCERTAAETFGDSFERGTDGGSAAVEIEFTEIFRRLKPGVEEVAAELEVVVHCG